MRWEVVGEKEAPPKGVAKRGGCTKVGKPGTGIMVGIGPKGKEDIFEVLCEVPRLHDKLTADAW